MSNTDEQNSDLAAKTRVFLKLSWSFGRIIPDDNTSVGVDLAVPYTVIIEL